MNQLKRSIYAAASYVGPELACWPWLWQQPCRQSRMLLSKWPNSGFEPQAGCAGVGIALAACTVPRTYHLARLKGATTTCLKYKCIHSIQKMYTDVYTSYVLVPSWYIQIRDSGHSAPTCQAWTLGAAVEVALETAWASIGVTALTSRLSKKW